MSRREKLIDSARPYLEGDAEVRYVVSGQTGAPQGLLGAMAIVAGKAKQRRVVVTDSSIYVLEGDFWGTAESKSLVARHEIGSVPVAYRGRALTIGDERI